METRHPFSHNQLHHEKELERSPSQQEEQYLQHEQQAHQCPACKLPVKPGDDICESCGKWLLEGQCCFCYTPFKQGQKFCSHCGNPPAGITCKNCGTSSNFHFCPSCEAPLSKKAGPMMQEIENSADMQALKALKEKLSQQAATGKPSTGAGLQNELNQLNAYFSQAASQPQKNSKPTFSFNSENKDFSKELANSQASLEKLNQASAPADDSALLEQIRQMQNKVFSSNQEARMYYMAIKKVLPVVEEPEFVGWLCNYAHYIHPQPNYCACPSKGGRWIYTSEVQWTGPDTFVYGGRNFVKPHIL